MDTGLFEVCLRTFVIYAFLLVCFRLLGKREVSQFTPFDLILVMVLANAVQNAMVGSNNSLPAGLAAASVLLLSNFLLNSILRRNPRLRRAVEGTPTLLMRHGRVEWRNLKKENLDENTLKAAVREHGLEGLHEVELAVLELDGTISVVGVHERSDARRKKKRKSNPRVRV